MWTCRLMDCVAIFFSSFLCISNIVYISLNRKLTYAQNFFWKYSCTSNRLRVRKKTMACSFIKNNSVFLHQTHRDQIVVYLKSPSPKKKNNGDFLHQKQWRFPSPGPARSRRIFPLRSVCGPQESRFL